MCSRPVRIVVDTRRVTCRLLNRGRKGKRDEGLPELHARHLKSRREVSDNLDLRGIQKKLFRQCSKGQREIYGEKKEVNST